MAGNAFSLQKLATLLVLLTPDVWSSFLDKDPDPVQGMRGMGRSLGEECSPTFTCNIDSKYRTFDGKCNNIADPLFGSSLRPYVRYLSPAYEDGISVIRGEGRTSPFPLPNPRDVSTRLSSVGTSPSDSSASLMLMQWGQFLNLDTVVTPRHAGPCCEDGTELESDIGPNCRPINVAGDPFYVQFNITCLKFTRTIESNCFTVTGQGGADGLLIAGGSRATSHICHVVSFLYTDHREQVNGQTSFVDASHIYGPTLERSNQLRAFSKGLLLMGEGQEELADGETCPSACPYHFMALNEDLLEEGIERFIAGDGRIEEQPGITSLQTVFVRIHNFIASELSKKYNSQDDEFLYQEARRMMGAILQMITYNEVLPIVLGTEYMNELGLTTPSSNYVYDPSLDPTAPIVFSTAALRFGHTLINDTFLLDNINVELRKSFNNHGLTLQFDRYPSDFVRGISSVPAQRFDHFLVRTLTNFLYARAPFEHGSDLLSRNIMRGRDNGIAPYNDWREFCGFSTFSAFEELSEVMPQELVNAFSSTYGRVEDIDLFPALISERSVPGALVGPTMQCLLGRHFHALKAGDRYWFENENQPVPFTNGQLSAIYNTHLSTIFCTVSNAQDWQKWAFRIPSESNPRISCQELVQGSVIDQISDLF